MAPTNLKRDYERLAWSWAEHTNPVEITQDNVESAYRCNIPRCMSYSCRRNCKGNPFCLASLGESRWFNEQKHDSSDDFDPDQELRDPNEFIGLKNLGATCYVNSLLQLWFHNLPFRKAVLDWNPREDSEEKNNPSLDSSGFYEPQTAIGHLQMLFALMQHSNKLLVDPTDFVLTLGLDRSYQQDAQEFSKLFLSNFVEEKFRVQSLPHIKNFIKDYFSGEYVYVTKCFACGNETDRSEIFYELVVNVCKTLDESMREFLKEELLEGDDQYFCNRCGKKQNAGRRIRLKYLPKVLNLQLMRFVFDRTTGTRKKLNSFIQFPETLDLAGYLGSTSTPQTNYKLSAVLMHCGSSAYSGHYVAHICDGTSRHWYKFNDETVEKIEGNRLKFGPEEDVMDGVKKIKPPKAQKSSHTSSNAYMLVYTRVDSELDSTNLGDPDSWSLQPHIKRTVDDKNDEHESFVHNMKLSKDEYKKVSDAKRNEMIDILKILPVQSENPENVVNLATVQVISVASLTSFLQNKSEPVDNTPLLCPHQKLSPSMVRSCKYISTEGAAKLFDHLSGGPQLFLLESICHECVQAKCEFLRVKKKTGDDAKEIQSMLKMKFDVSKPTFWVGKNSLKYWKSLVNKNLAMKKITNGVDSPSYNENNNLNQADNGIANVQSDDEKKQLSPISSSSDKKFQSSPLKSNSQSNNMLDTLAYNLFIDRRSNKECETNGDSIEDSVSESEVDKNSNGFRKRLLDCRHVEDEQLERTKRIRTSDRRVPSCNSSNDALQEINCNNTNTSCNNKNTIHPKDPLNSDQVNNTGKNIKETKSSFVISPEMTECYVLMENLETTFNLFKSKFLCVLKQQQNQQQKENPCDKIKNLQCTRVSPQGDNDIDEHFVGPDDVNSEQILTSKIEFNTYVKSESLDESFNRNNHLHINLESQEENVTSIEATSIMNSKLELNHVDKDLNGGQGTSLDNGGVSSPLKSYSNSIERVLEQNKKGTVKSPDLTKCEEDNDNEVETFRRNRTYDHNSCTKSTRTNQSKNEGLLYEDKAHSRFDDKQNDQVNGDNERRKRKLKDGDNDGEEDEESTDENTQKEFNEDILCPHGELIPDESTRRLVPQGVWSILSPYFPLARAFPHDAETCKKCEHRNLQDEVTKEENRRTAALHREKFAHLLNSKNRPSLASLVEEVQNMGPSDDNDLGNSRKLYMISREFLDTWKRFVRDSTKRDVPRELCNASLLCDHGKLLYEPELEYSADDNPVFVWVSEEEWSQLKAVFQVDYELSTFYCATVRTFINTPDICEECVTKRKASEEQEQLTYTRGKLVIRVANSDDSAPEDSAGKKTDEWSMNGKSSKGHMSNKSSSSDDVSVIANGSNAETTVRRSQRKRKAKNDVILTVSSSDTLMSVKVKILKRLCIAPYDQNLFLLETGRLLEENSATLQQLNVHRDSVILLKVNEPHQDEVAEFGKVQQQELGFSGTKLLGVDS